MSTTLSGTGLEIKLLDGKKLFLGNDNDAELVHDGGNTILRDKKEGGVSIPTK